MHTAGARDQQARDMASEAMDAITSHEKVCTVRWQGAMSTMADIKRILAYGTAGIISCMLALLIGFLATHTIVH